MSATDAAAPDARGLGIGLLLIGHGTRDPDGVAEFHDLTKRVASALPGVAVEGCFLEFARPSIAEGVRALVERGVREVIAMPLLLLAAGHAKRDIPEAMAAEMASYGEVSWRLAPHLGSHPSVLAASVRRHREALCANPAAPEKTLLLLVGRGSTDPAANAEMAHFARLRWELAPTAWYEVCFTALAEPSLARGLEMAAEMPMTHVVVQPHLLFAGRLFDRLRQQVEAQQHIAPRQQWQLCDPLGVSDELVAAIVDRAGMTGLAPRQEGL